MIDPTSTPPQKVTSKGIVARAIPTGQRGADDLAALTDRAPKIIDSLPGRNELNYWIDGGQDAVERGFPEEPFILLDKLYIDPQNRGQGAARQVLVEGLQEMAEQYPGMDVRLLAEPLDRSTNQSDLVRLYESVGFEVDNYQDGMSSIPMSLRLPKKVARTGGNTPPAALGYVKGGAVTKNNVERMRNDNRRYLG
jgi:GNAT superfamily N-acetyltransferase